MTSDDSGSLSPDTWNDRNVANGADAKIKYLGTDVARHLDAVGIELTDAFLAEVICPGADLHTEEWQPMECVVYYEADTGDLYLRCLHNECAFEVAAVNARLSKLA